MIEFDYEIIGIIITALAGAYAWFREWQAKGRIIEFDKADNDVYKIPDGVDKTAYIVTDKTRNIIISNLSASEKFTVNELIDGNNEYILKTGETIEYWVATSRGSWFINWRGMIGDSIAAEPEPTTSPMKPSGYVVPTNAEIKSGTGIEFTVYFNPDSGDDRVTEIEVDFNDGTPSQTYATPQGRDFMKIWHQYTYGGSEKFTGKKFTPKFVYFGARGTTMVLDGAVSVTVEQ